MKDSFYSYEIFSHISCYWSVDFAQNNIDYDW